MIDNEDEMFDVDTGAIKISHSIKKIAPDEWKEVYVEDKPKKKTWEFTVYMDYSNKYDFVREKEGGYEGQRLDFELDHGLYTYQEAVDKMMEIVQQDLSSGHILGYKSVTPKND